MNTTWSAANLAAFYTKFYTIVQPIQSIPWYVTLGMVHNVVIYPYQGQTILELTGRVF